MSESASGGQVMMDLGDFIPEEYDFAFSIRGKRYRFQYAEATVDEVLRLLAKSPEGEDLVTGTRRLLTEFLPKVIVEGDPKELLAGLATMPYRSLRGGLDLVTIYALVQGRVKKNDRGGSPASPV